MARSNKRSAKAEAPHRRDWLRIAIVVGLTAGVAVGVATLTSQPPDMRPLLGRWQRQNEQYFLVAQPTPGGPMQAEYFNPGPIHVAKTEAEWKEDKLHLFVELRDKGYPGSTYTLTYDPKWDVLTGSYYLAESGETLKVTFERVQ